MALEPMTDGYQDAGEDAKIGPIRVELNTAEEAVAVLEKRVGRLEARLVPVLGPGEPNAKGDAPKLSVPGSQVAGHVRTIGLRIQELSTRLGELDNRLEV